MALMEDRSSGIDLKNRILDAADRLLGRYGYQKMTMDDLAGEAKVGRRTIYLYFRGKEAIALASIDRVVERLLERLQAIARSNGSPDERLRQMLITRVLFRFDSVQDYYQSFDDLFAALRSVYMARREHYFREEARVFAEVLKEGHRSGEFSAANSLATAHTLLLATNALLPYSLGPQELGDRDEVKEKVSRIAGLLLNGLRKRD